MREALALAPERELSEYQAREIGKRAIWNADIVTKELGINDPLSHLEQYLREGETAIKSIDEDLITDIAERKLKPTFINPVKFDYVGGDFISRENKFSMQQMTNITESKFTSNGKVADARQCQRAKIESEEVRRLDRWFAAAEAGDAFIVESMGITETERYTIVRVHQKASQTELIEHVITLHGATVSIFNQLHETLGVKVPQSQSELELLDNMYSYRPKTDDAPNEYVTAFDSVLARQNPGQEFRFGIPKNFNDDYKDDVEAIRRQKALRSVYLDNMKTIGDSGGFVTPAVLKIASELGCSHELSAGSELSFVIARELMDRSLQSVAATFNRASADVLQALAASQDMTSALESASYYGGEARAEGVRYDGACPSSPGAAAGEEAALAMGHRFNRDPAQCGNCPKCGKEYYVPAQIYKEKIVHCGGCNSAISFGGGPVDWKVIEKYYGGKKPEIGFMDMLFLSIRKAGLEVKIEHLKHEAQSAGTEADRRKNQNELKEKYRELEAIKEAV